MDQRLARRCAVLSLAVALFGIGTPAAFAASGTGTSSLATETTDFTSVGPATPSVDSASTVNADAATPTVDAPVAPAQVPDQVPGQAPGRAPKGAAALVITKKADASPEGAGDQIGFLITLRSVGADEARDVVLTDRLPKGDGLDWSMATPVPGCGISGDVLTCTRDSMVPGDTFSVHLTSPTHYRMGCDKVENTASFTSSNAGSGSDSATIRITCAKIAITKIADAKTESAGNQIGFTIKVTNKGSDGARDVVMTDHLPSGTGIHWTIATHAFRCSIDGMTLTCQRDWLDPGESFSVHVVSPTTLSTECRTYTNTASVVSPNGGKDDAEASVALTCASVAISKVADAPTAKSGDPIGFTITVTNRGTGPAFQPVLTDAGLQDGDGVAWSLSSPVAGCGIALGTLTCQRERLDPGQSLQVHVTSQTGPTSCKTYLNTASVTSANGGAATASASVTVEGCPGAASPTVTSQPVEPASVAAFTPNAVLGLNTTRPSTPDSPQARPQLPMTGFDPRPLGLVALLALASGGVLCLPDRWRWWAER